MSAVHLNKADFLTKVANYEANPNEWKFLGSRPALIVFLCHLVRALQDAGTGTRRTGR